MGLDSFFVKFITIKSIKTSFAYLYEIRLYTIKGGFMLYNKPTRRQHYVWRYYLTPWANKDKKICCFFKSNKKTVFTSLMNIGQEKDFYAFSNITFEEIKLTEALFVNAQPNKRLNTFWINAYSLIHLIKETAQQEELSKEAQIHLNAALIELEEKVYCEIERDYQGYWELLKNQIYHS